MKDADLTKNELMDWLDKEEEYHRENAHKFGHDYSNGFITALQLVREKLEKNITFNHDLAWIQN